MILIILNKLKVCMMIILNYFNNVCVYYIIWNILTIFAGIIS